MYIIVYSIMLLGLCVGAQCQETRVDTGIASFYGAKFHGRPMANGKKFDANKLTAAHNKLPLGTFVRVRNLGNKKHVIVEITDRMHRKNKRLIDLSEAAAKQLNFIRKGLAKVSVEVVDKPRNRSR